MRRFKFGLAVALVICIIMAVSASLWIIHSQHPTESSAPVPTVAVRQASNRPEGWMKIEVDRKFSFYLPPDVKEEKPRDERVDFLGPTKSFSGKRLNAGYMYVDTWRNEELRPRKLSCDLLMKSLAAQPGFRSSDVVIGHKIAKQVSGQFDKSEMAQSTLCFLDAFDGTILTFTTSYEKVRTVDAEKIVGSLEFP